MHRAFLPVLGLILFPSPLLVSPASGQSWLPLSGSCSFPYAGASLAGFPAHVPYSVTVRVSFEQHLADGNAIHYSSDTNAARSSDSKTMEQFTRTCAATEETSGEQRREVTVRGPQAHTYTSWVLGPLSTHVATVRHENQSQPLRFAQTQKYDYRKDEHTTEDLGTKTIAGLQAKGVRWVSVVPAGAEGNDMPVRVTREFWTSQNPRLQLMLVEDDPRAGRYMWEITNLSLSEPDPAVFAPPQGYTLDEGQPMKPAPSAPKAGSQ